MVRLVSSRPIESSGNLRFFSEATSFAFFLERCDVCSKYWAVAEVATFFFWRQVRARMLDTRWFDLCPRGLSNHLVTLPHRGGGGVSQGVFLGLVTRTSIHPEDPGGALPSPPQECQMVRLVSSRPIESSGNLRFVQKRLRLHSFWSDFFSLLYVAASFASFLKRFRLHPLRINFVCIMSESTRLRSF